ncbi:hypothetical protein PF010_g31734 [Phytophthora fragariae]|uniref:Uncharacterized protein n=1 Tax=Phytophthora fragariae TaxID=53985 RepID=A0A6A3VQ27_9STRA|nr:hypothetical protein PF010_g31734 [Phytophthora fragariae]KAE9066249.1 hypothetical protein PF006_g30285 [Phytophthora fragariae]KAE9171381.1 hypothetical protein PF002_g29837 [Phytophthora fragariae]
MAICESRHHGFGIIRRAALVSIVVLSCFSIITGRGFWENKEMNDEACRIELFMQNDVIRFIAVTKASL